MLNAYWGATGDIGIVWPDDISGWLLLLCSLVFFAVLLFLGRDRLSRYSTKQWILLLVLSGFGLFFSQLLPTPVPAWLADLWPSFGGDEQVGAIVLLSAVFYLLAGAILGPAAALIVGFSTGVGHALGLTQQPYTPFIFAFSAWLAAQLMQQNYQGQVYAWLRVPLVTGAIAQISAAGLAALAVLVNTSGFLAALDAALATFQTLFWPLLLEGLVSGALVTVLLRGMAQWLPQRQLVPSPSQRSVRSYLLTNVLLFGGVVLLLSTVFVFALSIFLSSRLMVTQLAASSNAAAALIEELRSDLEDVLSQSAGDDDFARGDKASAARALGRAYRNAEHFQEVMLVDEQMELIYAFPEPDAAVTFNNLEQEAIARAIEDGLRMPVVVEIPDRGRVLSMVMPVAAAEGQPPKALIGRVQLSKLAGILEDLQLGDGSSLLIDRDDQVLTASGNNESSAWISPQSGGAQNIFVPAYLGGEAFLMENARQSRDIHYLSPPNHAAWQVVSSMPYEFVLNQAFASALPVVLVLLAATALFYARFASYGQNLARPISNLALASRAIAAGRTPATPIDAERQDEVGELGRAFTGMQRALKGRLDELSLLLVVSQDISTSIDINQSMPIILQGALRGTGAAGARAVIRNPNGPVPLTFAEGPAGEELAVFDRSLMAVARDKKEISLNSSRRMGQLFGLPPQALPAKALFVIPLQSQNQFQGVFFLGYRQTRDFNSSEKDLLHTLAGQATVLVENAHLFAKAEGGRERLRAVLDSTTEAVIVTDQTERILILNEAMEKAFQISANQVIGRSVKDVIRSPELLQALAQSDSHRTSLELEGKDGLTFNANVSTIVDRQGQVMGRVAVLHDVTQFKEVDRLKSEFVSNVSHDIKTPLTIISSSASQLAITENFTAEQRGYTDNILASVDRMVNLVDNLLDLSRLEGGLKLVYEQFDVGSLLTDLADDHWLHAHNGGVTIRTKVAPDVPMVTADRAWLYQALQNLLTNAFKYAPNSGELLLSAVRSGDRVVISLRDKGPGIAEENQSRLFEKFYRVTRHGSGKAKGTGLGLALVETVAVRHGGQAWCQSELGRGSTFTISLPVDGSDN